MVRSACELDALPASAGCAADTDETIGGSAEGRPLQVSYCGDPDASLKVLIIAGQHGDESEARKAAAEFVSRSRAGKFRAAAYAAVVVDANPDGSMTGTRRNAQGTDLNRDHLFLSAPETEAVHGFAESWQPDVIIDVHTYRPWRRELMALDLVYAQEVMIDFPTNPAISTSLSPALRNDAMEFVHRRLAKHKMRCGRYTIVRSGIVRHSSTDIVDARNGLALRFAIPAILIEGRRSSPNDILAFGEPEAALLRAIESTVEFAATHARELRKRPACCERGERVSVRCRYSKSRTACRMEMQSASTGKIAGVRIPGMYLPTVRGASSIRLPVAYGVPRKLPGVLEVLDRHRLHKSAPDAIQSSIAEVHGIDAMIPASDAGEPPTPACIVQTRKINPEDFTFFSTAQIGGRLLALLLEPASQFGPARLPELAEALRPDSIYPVIRLV